MTFAPNYAITPGIATALMRIEAAKQAIATLPITPRVIAALRETARLHSTHYSTMIEGNRLTQEQVEEVLTHDGHFPGRARDEKEVLGYYAALAQVERWAAGCIKIGKVHVQSIHALVMAEGRKRVKPTPFRDGQNVIRDQSTRGIVYMPPEAQDVPALMREMVAWINDTIRSELPAPLRAGIAHYQFATIHPYYDGNGRTARLLTTLILHLSGYDLKGIYSLEEYYARDLGSYYEALSIGPSHNYYMGRTEADITKWIAYFCEGMADSFDAVKRRAEEAAKQGQRENTRLLRELDARQRKVLALFEQHQQITTTNVSTLFHVSPRTARHLCQQWVETGFLMIYEAAKKTRSYTLAKRWRL